MKVLLINTSNRKKNTFNLLSSIGSLLNETGFDTEIISLKDYKLEFCSGCECCILKDKCYIDDDVNIIMRKIIESDGLIIGTPVYLNNMSGILKTFLDRTCKWFHRTEVAQKPSMIVSTTQGSGLKNTMNSIEESISQWGVALCCKIGRNGRTINTPIKRDDIKNFIALVNNSGKGYSPSLKEITTFNVQKALSSKIFKIDLDYWNKKGWTDFSYFPDANISFAKRAYGNLIFKILYKNIKPH